MKKLHILIADDHEMVRRGLRATIEAHPNWQVAGEASDGRQAVKLAGTLHPDLIVLDINMPQLNGLEATRQIRAETPGSRVLILTVHESSQVVREVLQAGAQGYLLKSDAGRELDSAVESLLADKPYFTSKVGRMVLSGFVQGPEKATDAELTSGLTPRERETVQLIAEGKSNKEVASALDISVKTVETHRSRVMKKLSLHSVTQLVRYAIRQRMIEP
jgi:DNA-binding NarL/FixJ family response regulator